MPNPKKTYEYLVILAPAESDPQSLTQLGIDGWELIAVIGNPGDRATYYSKREL